jgi:hypothetical protein
MGGLEHARARAYDVRCKNNLHQIGIACLSFAVEHAGVLPAGSVSFNEGPLPWQKCWMGQEVLPPGVTTCSFWPAGRTGVLLPYIGGNPETARKLYRCRAERTGPQLGAGVGSNGYFDYSMVMFWAGAIAGYVPGESELRYSTGDPSTWRRMPTPLVVEEDPYWWMNRYDDVEPGHGNLDRIGVWHYGHGNYLAVGGSVHECRPLRKGDLNPFCNNWYTRAPKSEQMVSIGTWAPYGSWKDR